MQKKQKKEWKKPEVVDLDAERTNANTTSFNPTDGGTVPPNYYATS
jgi:hypothetical protein